MLVALGWMLLAGLPLANLSPVQPTSALATAGSLPGAADGRIAVWTDRDDPYRRGEGARVYLRLDEPAHVTVFRVDTDGRIRVLFPREPWGDTFIRGEHAVEVAGSRGGRSFIVDDYPGIGYLFAVASPDRFDYHDIARGDYWDYRLIDGGRIEGDPYVVLTDLADRISRRGDYDYDIAPYHVDRHYEYPRFVCYDCHAYASFDQWDPYREPCTRFRVVVYDDPRYYPYRYGRERNVVVHRPSHLGPRYVFRDADPQKAYVTRVPSGGRPDEAVRRRGPDHGRTSEDIGGPGSVPTPGLRPSGDRTRERAPEPAAARRLVEDRRRDRVRTEAPDKREPAVEPDRRKPETRRRAEPTRRERPPRSTGEPELRRRKP